MKQETESKARQQSVVRGRARLKVYVDRTRSSQLAQYLFYHPADCPTCFKPHSSSLYNCHISLHGKTEEHFYVCPECFSELEKLGVHITRFKQDDWIDGKNCAAG